ncbi:methyltransferase domain-containing protein [Halomonas campisalis]|uniref:Arsenite methyltransferase n=1 Tax=Billgrantia campisalis TaxID=74661 RepID=A0ABS9PBA3_9GAMM|nr:methyltransferase domain-containing protein [Halomonas campisalis]MCG6658931.1 methyltransferase domain-containing protein [Halomonas campisalis]MDR5863652.1 methyltransferase domain-containing protein [Halomonas campisalis]
MSTATTSTTTIRESSLVDQESLRQKVKEMYRRVAKEPEGDFHFAMGRPLAEELGYPPADLDRIPRQALESFAGVGHFLALANIQPGETVLDLGSGSGTDAFLAALYTGPEGRVLGLDMTDEQRDKAQRLARDAGFTNITFHAGYIEEPPFDDASVDVVISNGVINLSAQKDRVFAEIARVLKPGGRLALSDIVTESQLPEKVKCDATLWAACIGGAMQQDDYQRGIRAAGLRVERVQDNPQYRFLTEAAQGASRAYGVKSLSLLATKPA